MEALLAGKHVLVEKPLAASSAECEELIETAKMVGRTLMVGHTFQYNPAVVKLRELIQNGDLGRILYIDCARLNLGLFQRDINVVWDLAPHDLSILLYILREQPESVSATGDAHILPDVDDLARLELRFPGDVKAHVCVSWMDPAKVRRLTVIGSKKMAVFDDTAPNKLQIYDKWVAVRTVDGATTPGFDYHDGEIEVPELEEVEPLKVEIEHYVECIKTGRRPISDGTIGLDVVRILEAADSSRRHDGQPMWIQPSGRPHMEVLPPVRGLRRVESLAAAEAS
jgi:predicted dehydrogenase